MSSPLSGFTAVPNPQMLAFMGAQSFIMMFQAGEGWQYGKRRISAMSNEDFNKLTPERLLQNQAATLRSSLATIQTSMNAMTPMIGTIVKQYGDFLHEIIKAVPETAANVFGGGQAGQNLQGNIQGGLTTLDAIAEAIARGFSAFAQTGTNTKTTPLKISDIKTVVKDAIEKEYAGSRVIGPTENPPTSGPSTIHPPRYGLQGTSTFLGGPAPGTGQRPTTTKSGFQPGQSNPVAAIQAKIKANLAEQAKINAQPIWGRGVTSVQAEANRIGKAKKQAQLRAQLTQLQRDLVLAQTRR